MNCVSCLRFLVACLANVGVGCTSAAVHYYTLTPPPGKDPPASETAVPIDVRIVHLPPQLNRSELMVRSGATEVTLLENERWASPVNDEIKDAVRLELQRRLRGTTGLRPDLAKLTVDIDVRHLEAEFGRYAVFEASWTATSSGLPSNGARMMACTFRADEEIHSSYAGMVAGYQREIAALAEAIVDVLTTAATGVDAPCQKFVGHAQR